MAINFLSDHKGHESAEALHRREFIERMERKLEFKQQLRHERRLLR